MVLAVSAADFGSKAASVFTDAFSAVAAGLAENLRYMGPIPDKEKNHLLITGTAIGSFGFEFELPAAEEIHVVPNRAEDAMQNLERLFQVAAEGTDDDIAELVDEIHPRAVKKAADFLDYIGQQGAWCGLEFKERVFRFAGVEQVRASAERLTSNNIRETDESFSGEFQGVEAAASGPCGVRQWAAAGTYRTEESCGYECGRLEGVDCRG